MNKKNNPEAWAAWERYCQEQGMSPSMDEIITNYRREAFWAGWQAAVREVIDMQESPPYRSAFWAGMQEAGKEVK